MSGYKLATVNISQDEFNRLRDAEIKLRSLPELNADAYNSIVRKSEQKIQSNFSRLENRQAIYETTLIGMNKTVGELESSVSQALIAYEADTIARVQDYAGNLWENFSQIIDVHSEDFNRSIAEIHLQYQDEFSRYSNQMQYMVGNQARKQALAYEWYTDASQLYDFIKQNYDHEWFFPGQLASLERELEQANENLENGLSEAVIVSAQQLYRSFSDLRINLELAETEWNFLVQTSLETVREMLMQAETSRIVPAVDLDGNLLSFTVNVDYWTQDRLSLLMESLKSIIAQLEEERDLPDSETLKQWMQNELPIYYQTIEQIILEARIAAINSQLRINIADLVVQSLQEQGFALEISSYEAGDMRNAYDARLVNLEGQKVLVQVAPTGQDIGENELHLQSFDREVRTEHELQRRWYEVSRTLTTYGLEVGAYAREERGVYLTKPGTDRYHQTVPADPIKQPIRKTSG